MTCHDVEDQELCVSIVLENLCNIIVHFNAIAETLIVHQENVIFFHPIFSLEEFAHVFTVFNSQWNVLKCLLELRLQLLNEII